MSDVGERLRRLRRAAGRTQAELGRLVGVPQATISKWEKGVQQPASRHAARLSEVLGEDFGYLYGLAERPQAVFNAEKPEKSGGREYAMSTKQPIKGEPSTKSAAREAAKRHPAWGVWKGLVTLDPNYDYTQPAEPDYED